MAAASFISARGCSFPKQGSNPGPCPGRVESAPGPSGSPRLDWWLWVGSPRASPAKLASSRASMWGEPEEERDREPSVACDAATPHGRLLPLQLRSVFRSTSLVQPTLKGRGLHKSSMAGGTWHWETIQKAAYPWRRWRQRARLPVQENQRRGFNPCSGRYPGGGHGNPLQRSCLENPRTEEPGGLHSMGSQRVRQDWSDLAHTTPDMELKWILFCPLTLTESAILHIESPFHKSCILIPQIPSNSTYGSRRSWKETEKHTQKSHLNSKQLYQLTCKNQKRF